MGRVRKERGRVRRFSRNWRGVSFSYFRLIHQPTSNRLTSSSRSSKLIKCTTKCYTDSIACCCMYSCKSTAAVWKTLFAIQIHANSSSAPPPLPRSEIDIMYHFPRSSASFIFFRLLLLLLLLVSCDGDEYKVLLLHTDDAEAASYFN